MSIEYTIHFVNSLKHGKKTRPAKLFVDAGDKVRWMNDSPDTVNFRFPSALNLFTTNPDGTKLDHSKSVTYDVKQNATAGPYRYKVTDNNGQEYKGDSDPEVDV